MICFIFNYILQYIIRNVKKNIMQIVKKISFLIFCGTPTFIDIFFQCRVSYFVYYRITPIDS